MKPDAQEQDDLWSLLGKARQPVVSPLFSRNVLREVRSLTRARPGFSGWVAIHWRLVALSASTACAVIFASGAFVFDRREASRRAAAVAVENQQIFALATTLSKNADFQVISHLDELLDSEKDSVWLDSEAD